MLETFVIMGLTAVAGSWIALADPLGDDDTATDIGDSTGEADSLYWAEVGDLPGPAPETEETPGNVLHAGDILDNFDPDADRLTIVPPEGWTGDEAEVTLTYDPHFHETRVTVTGDAGDSFDLTVTGVTPDDIAPEALVLA